MNQEGGPDRIKVIVSQLRAGESFAPLTVREFLSWFGAKRRGYWVASEIRRVLQEHSIETDPDFESTYIDGQIQLRLATSSESLPQASAHPSVSVELDSLINSKTLTSLPDLPDPSHRISKLLAANNPPQCIAPDSPINEAVTLMLAHGYSQLPVTTTLREVKGVISWQSIGARLSLGIRGNLVRDMMERHHEVQHDISIFQAIPIVVSNDYVLVRGADRAISGIVTASDLSLQFLQLSEPFLLLSEIENQVRRVISKKFQRVELGNVRNPLDAERAVSHVSDLTFGEYIRLLENAENWVKSELPMDRGVFCSRLEVVRKIRNDVMHFDPDGISPSDLETLREFARFFQKIFILGIA